MAKVDPGALEALETASPSEVQAYFEEQARKYEEARWAQSTVKQYASQWSLFCNWCASRGFRPLPATVPVLRQFVTYELERLNNRGQLRRVAGIRQALSAIRFAHHIHKPRSHAPVDHPDVVDQIKGRANVVGPIPVDKAEALTPPDLLTIIATMGSADIYAVRDRALLALGFAGAMRRSELVKLRWRDVVIMDVGVVVSIVSPKARPRDQVDSIMAPCAQRQQLLCPVHGLRAWRYLFGVSVDPDSPVFQAIRDGAAVGQLQDRDVGTILQARAAAAGIPTRFTAHSLRVGWATWAAHNNRPLSLIMLHMRHLNISTTANYVQKLGWAEHPGAGLY